MKTLLITVLGLLLICSFELHANCVSLDEAKLLLHEELVINTDEEVYQDLNELKIKELVESLGFDEESVSYETSEYIRHRECLYSLEVQCNGQVRPRKRACLIIRYEF